MSITRAAIVAEARSWVGTPTAEQGRMKGAAADCIAPVIACGILAGAVPAGFDVRGYPRDPDGTLLAHLDRHLVRIARAALQPGDVICARFASDPQHLGIVVPYKLGGLAIVHADSKRGRIVEHRLLWGSGLYEMKLVQAYAFPGVED